MSMWNESRDLEDLVRRLPRELPPPAELWPRIAARLQPRSVAPLDALARQLPADVAPPPNVWAGVAAAIGAAPARLRIIRYAALAASIIAAVGLLVAIVEREPEEPSSAERAAFEPSASPPSPLDVWTLDAPGISADVTDALRRDRAVVQAERASIERAIADAPNDPHLRELWAHAYETELELDAIYGRTIVTTHRRGSGI